MNNEIKNYWEWTVQKVNYKSGKVVNFVAECPRLKLKWVKFVCWAQNLIPNLNDGVMFVPTMYVPTKQKDTIIDKTTGYAETVESWKIILYDAKIKVQNAQKQEVVVEQEKQPEEEIEESIW